LHALVQWGRQQGLEQRVLCLLPVGEDVPSVGGLDPAHLQVIRCGEGGELPFAIPGMSDVMPYASTVFGEMDAKQLEVYGQVLGTGLARSLNEFQPDVIHAHHAWIGAGIACELAGSVPVILHGHGTGLRQMGLLPRLAEDVRAALSRITAVCVLHEQHAEDYARVLALDAGQVHIVGAGFDQEIFVPGSSPAPRGRLLFAGKWAAAKGLGPLRPMPELMGPDSLAPGAEAGFVQNLEATLAEALDAGPAPPITPQTCAPFTWTKVAERVHRVWRGVVPT
jgi:hypothetical protein